MARGPVRLQGPKSAAPGVLAHRGSARGQRGGGEPGPGPSRLPPERCATVLQQDGWGPVLQAAAASLLAHPEPAGPPDAIKAKLGPKGECGWGGEGRAHLAGEGAPLRSDV